MKYIRRIIYYSLFIKYFIFIICFYTFLFINCSSLKEISTFDISFSESYYVIGYFKEYIVAINNNHVYLLKNNNKEIILNLETSCDSAKYNNIGKDYFSVVCKRHGISYYFVLDSSNNIIRSGKKEATALYVDEHNIVYSFKTTIYLEEENGKVISINYGSITNYKLYYINTIRKLDDMIYLIADSQYIYKLDFNNDSYVNIYDIHTICAIEEKYCDYYRIIDFIIKNNQIYILYAKIPYEMTMYINDKTKLGEIIERKYIDNNTEDRLKLIIKNINNNKIINYTMKVDNDLSIYEPINLIDMGGNVIAIPVRLKNETLLHQINIKEMK